MMTVTGAIAMTTIGKAAAANRKSGREHQAAGSVLGAAGSRTTEPDADVG
jgi:hypothetical protein